MEKENTPLKFTEFANFADAITVYWRIIKMLKKFITSRLEERTSWDGAMLIAVGLIILIAGPFAKLAAYIAIGYGAWTIYKSE